LHTRVLNRGVKAVIEEGSWEVKPVFKWIQKEGNIPDEEMYRTFNMGLGMILAVDKKDKKEAVKILEDLGEKVFVIGRLERENGKR